MAEGHLEGVTGKSAEHHGVHVTALEGAREGCPALQLSGDSRKTFFQRRESSHIPSKHTVCGWPSACFSLYSGTNVP